ncbi:uncharacterized protein TrAtP1_003070 [Trichoderma atroviride]|uniref:uncharacterized protein n=1 Tax=Hypocrea atroviridis TaxID=63577 RepID=UPI00331F4EC6|nr:hypothetical protein TrAtP1_003070 [Trichoderma atroviride]
MKNAVAKFSGYAATRAARPLSTRSFMTTAKLSAATPPPQASENGAINPRWLSDLQGRLTKSLSLKLSPEDAGTVKDRLAYLDKNWLVLSAGREGFLAEPERRGVDGHAIQWGDMVRRPYPSDNALIREQY